MATNSPESIEMATRLKDLRNERKLSHAKLSDALKEKYGVSISKDSLIAYEVTSQEHAKAGANQGMRAEYLRCLADFYGVSAGYILGTESTRSPDSEVRTSVKCTGLTEENTVYLRTIRTQCEKSGANVNNFSRYELMLINTFIELCNDGRITTYFWTMHRNLEQIKAKEYDEDELCGYPTNNEFSNFIKNRGLTVLPLRSGIEYNALEIADELKEEIIRKYIRPVLDRHTKR